MTAKEYLSKAKYLDELINSHMADVEYWRNLSLRVAACKYEDHPNGSGNRTDASFVNCIAKMDEALRLVNKEISRLADLRREIDARINMLADNKEKLVLRYKYLSDYTWPEIHKIMGRSERTVKRIHKSALEHFSIPD